MRKLFFLIFMFFTGCGEGMPPIIGEPISKSHVNSNIYSIISKIEMPKDLANHVADFALMCDNTNRADLCRQNLRKIRKIDFVDSFKKQGTIGSCWVYITGYRKILILKNYVLSNSIAMKTLIFHELGHCALDLEHKGSFSIMSPTLTLYEQFKFMSWHDLLKEMFEQTPGKTYLSLNEDSDELDRQHDDFVFVNEGEETNYAEIEDKDKY